MIRCWALLFAPVIACAQSAPTAPQIPLLGYLVSGSPLSVRPVEGAPGAVVLGAAIPLPAGLTSVAVAPGQQFAIVESSGAGGSAVLMLSLDGSGALAPIANSFAHSDHVAFSPSGSVAVLYSAAAQQAQVITGLPSGAQVSRTVELGAISGLFSSIAVSDDAQVILLGVSDRRSGTVWRFAAGQSAAQAAAAGFPSAIRFFPGSEDAVFADRAWQQIVRLPAGSAPQVLAGPGQGLCGPSDLEISSDQQTIWIADSNGPGKLQAPHIGQIVGVGLSSGAVTQVTSPMVAANLTHLAGESVFLLSSADGSASGIWAPLTTNAAVWQLTGAGLE